MATGAAHENEPQAILRRICDIKNLEDCVEIVLALPTLTSILAFSNSNVASNQCVTLFKSFEVAPSLDQFEITWIRIMISVASTPILLLEHREFQASLVDLSKPTALTTFSDLSHLEVHPTPVKGNSRSRRRMTHLSRSAPVLRFVRSRQTFVRRCHDGWDCTATDARATSGGPCPIPRYAGLGVPRAR